MLRVKVYAFPDEPEPGQCETSHAQEARSLMLRQTAHLCQRLFLEDFKSCTSILTALSPNSINRYSA